MTAVTVFFEHTGVQEGTGKGGEDLGTTTRRLVKEEGTAATTHLLVLQPTTRSSGN